MTKTAIWATIPIAFAITIGGLVAFMPSEEADAAKGWKALEIPSEIQVTQRTSSFVNANSGNAYTLISKSCLSGEVLVGGGYDAPDTSSPIIVDNKPSGNSWQVGFKGPTSMIVRAIALCATLI